MHSTIKEPPPTIKTLTSQKLLLAIPYNILFSNFEKLQGQGKVIPASLGRDYLGNQGLEGSMVFRPCWGTSMDFSVTG